MFATDDGLVRPFHLHFGHFVYKFGLLNRGIDAHDMSEPSDSRSPISTQRNLRKATEIIDEAGDELGTSESLAQTTTMLYNTTLESQDDYLNWSIRETVAACLYLACRLENAAYTPSEISTTFDIKTTVLFRRSKAVLSEVAPAHEINIGDFINPTEYVDRYCDELELKADIAEQAKQIIRDSKEAGLTNGKSPSGVAAAAVYNAVIEAGESVTQSDLSHVADVSEVTIRNRYQEQREVIE